MVLMFHAIFQFLEFILLRDNLLKISKCIHVFSKKKTITSHHLIRYVYSALEKKFIGTQCYRTCFHSKWVKNQAARSINQKNRVHEPMFCDIFLVFAFIASNVMVWFFFSSSHVGVLLKEKPTFQWILIGGHFVNITRGSLTSLLFPTHTFCLCFYFWCSPLMSFSISLSLSPTVFSFFFTNTIAVLKAVNEQWSQNSWLAHVHWCQRTKCLVSFWFAFFSSYLVNKSIQLLYSFFFWFFFFISFCAQDIKKAL